MDECPTYSTQSEECPSIPAQNEACSLESTVLACAITAIVTALLATAIFVLVLLAVCKCHPKLAPRGAKTPRPPEGAPEVVEVEELYDEVVSGENTTRDGYPKANEVYEVVGMNGREEDTVQLQGRGHGGGIFQITENEAYIRHQ